MSAHPPRPARNAGFLLSEALAVLAISAIVLVGLASTARFLVRFTDRSVAQAQEADTLGRTLSALTRDISSLARARWNGFEPQGFVFRGGPNSLYFARHEVGRDGAPEDHVIALREINTDAGPRLMRSEAHLSPNAASFDDLQFGPQRVIDTGPARLRFWYISGSKQDTGQRQNAWHTDAQLPRAIIVEVVDAATTRLIATANVAIRANADIGCIEGDGDEQARNAQAPLDPATGRPIVPGVPSRVPPDAADDGTPQQPGDPGQPGAGASGANGAQVAKAFCGRDDAEQPHPQQAPPQLPPTGPRATL